MRPHIILNTAMSVDGKISRPGERILFSNIFDKMRVRQLRRRVDGIMVGINTVLVDDPKLTASNHREKNPVRIIVDSAAKTPPGARVLNDDASTIIVAAMDAPYDNVRTLKNKADVIFAGKGRVDLYMMLIQLYERGIKKVLLEGGGILNHSMLKEGYVDEIFVTIAPTIIGDGVDFVRGEMKKEIKLKLCGIFQLGDQIVIHYFPHYEL